MFKKFVLFVCVVMVFVSCQNPKKVNSSVDPVNWKKRQTFSHSGLDSLKTGTTYLSVYSEIYSQTEHITHELTVTVSMRNVNRKDSIFVASAQYFDTHGELIHSYFEQPIFIAPMETVEIVIDEKDTQGGTGGNFLFDWKQQSGVLEPLFDAVMISTSGQQGLSFSTQGKRIQ
ncbi:DUF3124 domain-containing protein [Mangrovimonas sp. AS39]|uniref:DUF3124 domain-containing protein n=1 Tax=Mangrovimonas futianensis TaxID=2895523 RepID=UPI001E594612|nr:DUF3124 domain-containing protein [Mangrovimonas futianensis]MCF1191796.1 DUF3124 domain-containing protein [Mangrovimonas futianensis]MCF1195316.1 DUF3124 domain-containing protein [Mangrovimonas futianensis]